VLRYFRVRQDVEAAPLFHQFAARGEPLKIDVQDFAGLEILRMHEPGQLHQRKERSERATSCWASEFPFLAICLFLKFS